MESQNSDIQPLQVGYITNPPSLVLLYMLNGKKRKRRMPLIISNDSTLTELKRKVLRKNREYLKHINSDQLLRLLSDLLNSYKNNFLFSADGDGPCAEDVVYASTAEEEEDLSKLDDAELNAHKQRMDVDFEKHRVRRDDADFEYEVERDFGPPAQSSGWDDFSDEEDF
eukprot:GCRY01002887.1.p1 GENE.GCRY01002887.1~~GCRY01002887.1.p1  ORF type:complete len:169 (+),score=43.15 GCRY01002887.1:85-591(+)